MCKYITVTMRFSMQLPQSSGNVVNNTHVLFFLMKYPFRSIVDV